MSMGPIQLSPEELDHPVPVRIREWLKEQVVYYQRQIAGNVLANAIDHARTGTGALTAYEELLLALTPGAADAAPTEEEPYSDPAQRMSLRRAAR